MTDFVASEDFIGSFTRDQVASMLEYGQIIMRRCHVCDEPQFALPETVRAWDNAIEIECLCHRCQEQFLEVEE